MALMAGLSAGVCEEGARWLIVTFLARRIRGWRAGLQYGAGHGGAESIILGLIVALNLIAILVARSLGPATQILPAEALAQLQAAQDAYWSQSAALPLVAAFERICTIILHISWASLVVAAVTQRKPLYFVAALALHTLVDFWAVVGATRLGIAAVETGVALFALLGLWIIWRLRQQPGAEPSVLTTREASSAPPSAADLAPRELTAEELARRADLSKYE
jgi:uncharacterized membrane protein YhfC